jgi:hypothetical protein
MHLNKILEQIKRHQSPTEAIDKLATALEKHEGSLLEKGFTILKSELAAKRMGWKWLRSWKPSRNKFGFRSFSCYG